MSFYDELQKAESEEDVKDIYIRELELKGYKKGRVDLQTNEIWFEAKTGGNVPYYEMFTQLLYYVNEADKKGAQRLPPILAVIDQEKAALMKTKDVLPLLRRNTIKWGKSAGKFTQETLEEVSKYITVHFVRYDIKTRTFQFKQAVRRVQQYGEFPLEPIHQGNLKDVFDEWVDMIGREINGIDDEDIYRLFFFTDIMHDNKIPVRDDLPAELVFEFKNPDIPFFEFKRKTYKLNSADGYRQFWMMYDRPPAEDCQSGINSLLRRGDKLIPTKKRMFKGAYYTPDWVVDKAYDTLTETLGKNWQKEYFVWDMCCGGGNLEVIHSNPRNVFMSTLDDVEIKLIKAERICVGSHQFQYDYLNDDVTDEGEIDYSITDKIPQELRDAIKTGKKILVLMNPPYAEATNATNTSKGYDTANKTGVAKTKFAEVAMQGFGRASNELYTQFLARIAKEIPTATIAMFSTLKHVSAPNSEKFRQNWNAEYLNGFIVHSRAFESLDSDFPIGFLIWKTHHGTNQNYTIDKISTEIIDEHGKSIGHRNFYNKPNETMLNQWIDRPRANKKVVIPLKNAISLSGVKKPLIYWNDDALAYMYCGVNDIQHAGQQTALYSSTYGGGHGFYVTRDNLEKAAMTFTARRIVKATWFNDRDQFFIPTGKLTDEFKNDCLIYMLFSNSNLTAGADGLEWDDKKWSLVNHFIPFSEDEVKAPKRFESAFMAQYLTDKKLSPEAKAVMAEGRVLWQTYFSKTYNHKVRDLYKLGRSDVGWYQIRNALKEGNKSWDTGQTKFTPFEDSYKILSDKLRPQIFDLGFLMR